MGRAKKPWGGPLTLEKYHRFFADPLGARLTVDNLNHILSMHGFVKLHREHKKAILKQVVGQVDLQPPRYSTLHTAARPSAARSIAAAQAAADVDAIGWTECPIGAVLTFAGFGEDLPEPLEPMPPPAYHVLDLALAVRRPRSKRTRGSAYGPRRVTPEKADVKEDRVEVEEGETCEPPPSPPPMWMRSPTPPPPPTSPPVVPPPPSSPPPTSPPRPQTVVPHPPSSPSRVQHELEPVLSPSGMSWSQPGFSSSPPPGFSSPPPPGFCSPPPPGFGSPPLPGFCSSPPPGFGSPPPPGFGSPASPCWSRPTLGLLPTPSQGFVSPPPPCWNQPTLGPIPAPPPGFDSPQVTPPPQLSWGLPLPSGPGAPPTFTHHLQPAGPPPLWQPTVPPYYPATCWGAPSVLPPQQARWRWPHPPPRWAPPHMIQQQRRPPPWGCMGPSAPPPMPPQYPPHFEEQQHTSQPSGVSWARPRPVF